MENVFFMRSPQVYPHYPHEVVHKLGIAPSVPKLQEMDGLSFTIFPPFLLFYETNGFHRTTKFAFFYVISCFF